MKLRTVDSLTKKLGDLLVNREIPSDHRRTRTGGKTGFSIVRSRRHAPHFTV